MTAAKQQFLLKNLSRIARHVLSFKKRKDVILVTSGRHCEWFVGFRALKRGRPKLSELQAAAAVGQNILMHAYSKEFKKYGLKCAQIYWPKMILAKSKNVFMQYDQYSFESIGSFLSLMRMILFSGWDKDRG